MDKKRAGGSASEGLVVGSKVKAFVKAQGLKSSGELTQRLSAEVADLLTKACARAKANRRSTVREQDL